MPAMVSGKIPGSDIGRSAKLEGQAWFDALWGLAGVQRGSE